jgi:hypothetical protein
MKRPSAVLAAVLFALVLAGSAQADPSEYGLKEVGASTSTDQAGAHPDFESSFVLKTVGEEGKLLPSTTQRTIFELPAGLLGNPTAIPTCSAAQLIGTDIEDPSNATGCPQDSQVGVTQIVLKSENNFTGFTEPVFNLEPKYGEPARFGFMAFNFPVVVNVALRQGPGADYGATAAAEGISSLIPLFSADTTIWGVPADPSHDGERITAYEAAKALPPQTPTGTRSSSLVPVPFMLNPTRCGSPRDVRIEATPYALPGLHSALTAPMGPGSGCGLLEFKPTIKATPSTEQAESSAGLDFELTFPSDGLEHTNLLGEDEQKRAEVTLPEGVTVNPSQAEGLGVCSEADLARETAFSAPNEGCPETSKIGSVSADSHLVKEEAKGALYVAKPKENPFGSLIALYMVLKIPDRGVVVKLAGKVEPDPKTGQLITTFDDIPQLPVESFHLHFREGARAPLVTPPRCGTYTTTARFTSWSGQETTTTSDFKVSSGVDHGPCPQGTPPFEPGFTAKTLKLNAGSYSPFYMRLTRRDGDQDVTKFSATLPPGMVAKLAGVSECPDASIEAAKAKTGLAEQASPSCPASSQIGRVLAGAGVGSVLTYAEGKIYLAGPYQGAPLSVAAIVPAVAGPFDVGTVVTRQALQLNPRTGVVTADGEHSDPIPHILAGIPLKVRDVRVYVDRPDFTLNPTSCDPFATKAELWGGGNDVFSSLDDSPLSVSDRFQVADCSSLGFKPKLFLALKGGTTRGGHPALTGTYSPRPGDANLKGLVVRLPRSAFLDQAHIRTICTRVQFAANGGNGAGCPAGAVYGHVKAITPLLDQPLEGPVYLRSSNHNLPDFVAALHGLVNIEAVARIDSKDGGIRATFSEVPDAPLTKVVVQMQGAKKGLIVNSTNLCAEAHRADVRLGAQNGRRARLAPVVEAGCGGKDRGRSRHKH